MRVLLIFAAALALQAQSGIPYSYIASTGNVSLVGAGTAATLQQPTSAANSVSFPATPGTGASVYCSVACVVTISTSQSTTGAATTTAGTIVSSGTAPTPAATVKFFTSSNASSETTKLVINVAAGTTANLDMSSVTLSTGMPSARITISIASITGTANISFFFLEAH